MIFLYRFFNVLNLKPYLNINMLLYTILSIVLILLWFPLLFQSLKVLLTLKLLKDHFILFKSSLLTAGFCSLLLHLEFSATYRTDFDWQWGSRIKWRVCGKHKNNSLVWVKSLHWSWWYSERQKWQERRRTWSDATRATQKWPTLPQWVLANWG